MGARGRGGPWARGEGHGGEGGEGGEGGKSTAGDGAHIGPVYILAPINSWRLTGDSPFCASCSLCARSSDA